MSKFGAWLKNKRGTRPNPLKDDQHPKDHDSYTDEVYHHLNSLLKITHPDGDWARMNKHSTRSTKRIQDLHNHIKGHLDEIGKRTKAF